MGMSTRRRRGNRRSRRRFEHVVVLTALTAIGGGLVHLWWPSDQPTTQELSLLLGYTSLVALGVTLALGPLNVLARRPNPRSTDLRRDVGLWSAATGIVHIGFALQHHLDGVVAQYFFDDGRVALGSFPTTAFGRSNWLGVVAAAIIAVLAATSNDRSVRALGRRWTSIHRSTYVLAAVILVHSVLFWRVEQRMFAIRIATGALAVGVFALQVRGRRAVRAGRVQPDLAPTKPAVS